MRRVACVILASLILGPSAGAQEQDRKAQITALLQTRAKAVAAKDLDAFLGTSRGDTTFIQAQRRSFEGLVALGVVGYELALDLEDWPELTRRKDTDRHGQGTLVAYVAERYRLEGYDTKPAWNDLFLTFAQEGDRWAVVADDAVEDLGLFTSRQLWEFGPVGTATSEHFMAIHPRGDEADAQAILGLAEQAVAITSSAWPGAQIGRVPLVLPKDKAQLKRILGATFDVSNFVAFASSAFDEEAPDGWDLVGHRVIINPVNFARHTEASRRTILAHELVHIATRDQSGPFIPAFVDEGVAELTSPASASSLRGRARSGRFDRKLPDDWEFISGGGDRIYNSYLEAASAIDYMRVRWGIGAVKDFYAKLGSYQLEPGRAGYHIDSAMRSVIGIGLGEFEAAWAGSVTRGG